MKEKFILFFVDNMSAEAIGSPVSNVTLVQSENEKLSQTWPSFTVSSNNGLAGQVPGKDQHRNIIQKLYLLIQNF